MKAFSGALGSITCFVMIAICKKFTGENYEIWGWRLLFYLCSVMGMIGFLIRYIMQESLAYKTYDQNKNLSNSPFLELIIAYKKHLCYQLDLALPKTQLFIQQSCFTTYLSKNLLSQALILKM
jgi:MHS family proline/betaine transporter-like MFS transporter